MIREHYECIYIVEDTTHAHDSMLDNKKPVASV